MASELRIEVWVNRRLFKGRESDPIRNKVIDKPFRPRIRQ
jgi:hypothetical protein